MGPTGRPFITAVSCWTCSGGARLVLELKGLSRRFGQVVALDDLTFTVPDGQVFGFLGPNGSGKTTAMRAVFALVALDQGEVRWNGEVVSSPARRRFGYLPEERGLYPGMLVSEQIEYLARLHGRNAADAKKASTEWLERLGIAERATSKLEALSLGNQQRVQLAAALVHDPELLVLDEPLSGLDPAGIDLVGRVLAEHAAAGRCVVFSSHQLDLVEDLCESVAIIDHGHLVAEGRVDDLTTRGRRRLVVKVAGDWNAGWARALPGVTVSRIEAGAARLVLAEDTDPQQVLAAAMAAGAVEQFGFEHRRLSEVFMEAVS